MSEQIASSQVAGEAPFVVDQWQASCSLQPVAVADRLKVMDILRGFALIGIALMNIEWFNRAIADLGHFDFSLSGIDWSAGWLVRFLVEGKFYKLFSLLFGMGFAVMLLKAQQANRPFYGWFSRRMIVLFTFGIAHLVLLWSGDILHDYAVGGLLLLLWVWIIHRFAKLKPLQQPRWFLRIGLFMLALPFMIQLGGGLYFAQVRTQAVMTEDNQERQAVRDRVEQVRADEQLNAQWLAEAEQQSDAEEQPVDVDSLPLVERIEHRAKSRFTHKHEADEERQKEQQALGQGSWQQATAYRAANALEELKNTPFFAAMICMPMFMLGYWLVASGIMQRPARHKRLFSLLVWIGLPLGALTGLAGLILQVNPVTEIAIEVKAVAGSLFFLSQYLLTAGYFAGIVLICLTAKGLARMQWLAPLGQMALTNYLMQSVLYSSIFFGYAGGQFGHISRAWQILIVIAVIAGQVLFSRWWLTRFQFGPLEWLWRSATYLAWQPLRRTASLAVDG